MALPTQTIGGLSSGLDTNSIIESLVSIEKTQLTRLETKKENRELYLNAYYSVNSMLKEFLTSVEAITSKSAWNAKTTASSDDSILTATATDAAAVGTHTFRVGQLATSAQYMSGGFASKDNPILPSGAAGQKITKPATLYSKLSELNNGAGVSNQDTIAIQLLDDNGELAGLDTDGDGTKDNFAQFTVSLSGCNTIADVMNKVTTTANDLGFAITCVDNGDGTFGINYLPQRVAYTTISANYTAGTYSLDGGFGATDKTATINASFSTYLNGSGAYDQEVSWNETYDSVVLGKEKWTDANGEEIAVDENGRATSEYFLKNGILAKLSAHSEEIAAAGYTHVGNSWSGVTDGMTVHAVDGTTEEEVDLTFDAASGQWMKEVDDGNGGTTREAVNFFRFTDDLGKEMIVSVSRADADSPYVAEYMDANGDDAGFTLNGTTVAMIDAHWEDAGGNAVNSFAFTDDEGKRYFYLGVGADVSLDKYGREFTGDYWATADGSATVSLADMAAISGATLVGAAWDTSALFNDGQTLADTEGNVLTYDSASGSWLDGESNPVDRFAFTAEDRTIVIAEKDGAGDWSFVDTNGDAVGFRYDGKEVAYSAAHLEDAGGEPLTSFDDGAGNVYALVTADDAPLTHVTSHYRTESLTLNPTHTVHIDDEGTVSWDAATAEDGSYSVPASTPGDIVYDSSNGFAADAIAGIKFLDCDDGTAAADLGLTEISLLPPAGDTGNAVRATWNPGTTQTTEKGNTGYITIENSSGQAKRDVQVSSLNGGAGIYHGLIQVVNSAGVSKEIDLAVCATLDDVITTINSTSGLGVRAGISRDGNSLTLTDIAGGGNALKVFDVGVGTTATDLGLTSLTDNGDGSWTGGNINQLTETSSLSMLRNGLGVNDGSLGNLRVQCNGLDFTVHLEDCNTIGDVIWAFESAMTEGGDKLSDLAAIKLEDNHFVVESVNQISICSDTDDDANNTTAEELGLSTGTLVEGTTSYTRIQGLDLLSDLNSVSLYNVTGKRSFNEDTKLSDLGMTVGQTLVVHDRNASSGGATGTTTYTVTEGATLGEMMEYFNDIGNGANVSMYIDEGRGCLAIADLTGNVGEEDALVVSGTGAEVLGFIPDSDYSVATGEITAVRGKQIYIKGINGVTGDMTRDAATGKLTANLGTIEMNVGGNATTLDLTSLGADSSMNDLLATLNEQAAAAGFGGVSFTLNSAGNGIAVVNGTAQGVSFANATGTAAADLGLAGMQVVSGDQGNAGDLDTVWFTRSYALSHLTGQNAVNGSISITNTKGSLTNVDLTGCMTVGDVIDAINDSGAGITASINDTGDGLMLVDTNGGTGAITVSEVSGGSLAAQLGILGSDGSGYLNGSFEKRIEIDSSDSLNDVMNNIAAKVSTVNCSIINDGSASAPYRLVVSSKNSGAANDFILDTNVASLAFNKASDGQDAVMLYGQGNGNSGSTMLLSSTNSNNTAILGLTLDLKKISEDWVTITVGQDKEKITEGVKEVVSSFNSVAALVAEYDKYTYDEETKEKQKGIFFGDNNIRNLMNNMQNMFLEVSSTKYGNMSMWYDLGVTFGDDGTLSLDTEKLDDVIANNYDNLYKLMVRTGDVASVSANCSVTSTGAPAEGFARSGAINGDTNFKTFGKGNGFESANEIGSAGYTYTVLFDRTRNLDTIYLYHVDTEDMPAADYALKDFVIEYLNPNTNEWEEMRSINGNKANANYLGFGMTTACKGVRVVASSTNAEDGKFRLTEIVCNEAQGLASSMEKSMKKVTDVVDGWFVTIQKGIEDEIASLEEEITKEKDHLEDYEAGLITKYANMETVMNNLQAQATSITNLTNAATSSNNNKK